MIVIYELLLSIISANGSQKLLFKSIYKKWQYFTIYCIQYDTCVYVTAQIGNTYENILTHIMVYTTGLHWSRKGQKTPCL